ncbi:MAG: biopolymer transporter ExbD [Planctomycetota bacterium]|nr:biopolymer transporter ExbD [Planctomycetota bacterium]
MPNNIRQRKKDRRNREAVPMSAFADIAFLLIIFFILTATLNKTKGITTDIPAGEQSDQEAETTPTIQLVADKVLFDDKNVNWQELEKQLTEMRLPERENEQDRIVLIEAKEGVYYQNYYQAMVLVSKAGGVVSIVKDDDGDET